MSLVRLLDMRKCFLATRKRTLAVRTCALTIRACFLAARNRNLAVRGCRLAVQDAFPCRQGAFPCREDVHPRDEEGLSGREGAVPELEPAVAPCRSVTVVRKASERLTLLGRQDYKAPGPNPGFLDASQHASATPIAVLAAHPLIDIDSTVFIQFALFLLLYWMANKWLFQPYLALRQRRKDGIEGARAEAERTSASADAKLADYEKQLAVARAKGNEEGRKVRAEATASEREVTDKARTTAQKSIDEAHETLRSQTDAARAELMPQADAIAKRIATRLLGREVA